MDSGRILLRNWEPEHKVPSPVLSFVYAWRSLLAGAAGSFRPHASGGPRTSLNKRNRKVGLLVAYL